MTPKSMQGLGAFVAASCILTGCATFQSKTVITSAGDYSIHIISDYYSKAYLIESDNGLILVDSGANGNSRKILKEIGRVHHKGLKLIFITHAHFDHYASAKAIRKATGVPICIHEDDADAMKQGRTLLPKVRKWGHLMRMIYPLHELFRPTPKTEPDIRAVNGLSLDAFGVKARIIHLPGHTPGSSILLLDGRFAFVGDLVASRGTIHVQNLYANDWEEIKKSFEQLQAMHCEWIFPGHGQPFPGPLLEKIKVEL